MNTERESNADRVADRVAWERSDADDAIGVAKVVPQEDTEETVEEAHQRALDEWDTTR